MHFLSYGFMKQFMREGEGLRVGIIGTGNMGTILTEALIEGKAVQQDQIYITNRTLAKALKLKESYPLIHIAQTLKEVINESDLIFLCVKPRDIHPLIKENQEHFRDDQCVVSITSPVSVEQLEAVIPCSCIRAIPSITNRALSGVCLMTVGEKCVQHWEEKTFKLLSHIGIPLKIEQFITRVASDIVSCGPAFFSFILQKFIEAAVHETGINQAMANQLVTEMMIGMGKLFEKNHYSLATLQEKVCVKGGITGEGIKILEEANLIEIFVKLFQATHNKFHEDVQLIEKQFQNET